MSKPVVIFGNEQLARLAHFYFTRDSSYQVVAFTVDQEYVKEQSLFGLPLVPFESVHEAYPPDRFKMFVAIGYRKLNTLRTAKYHTAKAKGYQLVSYLSSKATHWGETEIGDNCFILENQVIQPFVRIGNNVTLWSGNHLGHDVSIEDDCWLSSHIVCSGGVRIGASSFIGVNATIRDGVQIGRECIIGAGAVILQNVKDREVYVTRQTERYRLNSADFERMMDISTR